MIRWFLLQFLGCKDIIKMVSVHKEINAIVLARGRYKYDHGNFERHFEKQKVCLILYENKNRFSAEELIVIHVKQIFLDGLSKKPDYAQLSPYFNLEVIGGPIQSTIFTLPGALAYYVNMQIDFNNGGGIYEMKGIVNDCMILFSGTGGSSTLRETVGQLFSNGEHD